MTDRFEQYRRELTKKLAYQYWERRGRPLGSPEIDWLRRKELSIRTCWLQGRNLRLFRFVWSQMRIRFADRRAYGRSAQLARLSRTRVVQIA